MASEPVGCSLDPKVERAAADLPKAHHSRCVVACPQTCRTHEQRRISRADPNADALFTTATRCHMDLRPSVPPHLADRTGHEMPSPIAAWIPEDPEREWEVAASAAVAWIEDQCRTLNVEAVLVTDARDGKTFAPSLAHFAARHSHDTPRARSVRGPKAVLAYVPSLKALDLSMQLARDTAVCVVESFMTPVAGWAAQLGATDLTQPGDAPTIVPTELVKAVERLKFYGNNGYGAPFDRDRANSILRDLQGAGLCDADWLAAAVMATGISSRGAERLHDLAEKASA